MKAPFTSIAATLVASIDFSTFVTGDKEMTSALSAPLQVERVYMATFGAGNAWTHRLIRRFLEGIYCARARGLARLTESGRRFRLNDPIQQRPLKRTMASAALFKDSAVTS